MIRGISKRFIDNLLYGKLSSILRFIKNDNTLDLEIREAYVNIYYRGGNALKITEKTGNYLYEFDKNYIKEDKESVANLLQGNIEKENWFNYFSTFKQLIDFYFSKNKKEEREFQQVVVRINNYSSISNSTDYFILDIEYDNHANARFDLVAIEWPSNASKRKLSKGYKPRLVVIEKKFGDRALSGSAGMNKHLLDFSRFISDKNTVDRFKNEMLGVFKQKRELGLIPCLSQYKNSNEVNKFDEEIGLAFLLANHDAASSKLINELNSIDENPASFFVSNFSGYGLFKANLYSYEEFNTKFTKNIYEI